MTDTEPAGSDAPPPRPRIVITGATGRLGRAVAALAPTRGFEVVAAVGGPRAEADRARSNPGGGAPPAGIEPPSRLPALLEGVDLYLGAAPAEAERLNLPRVAAAGIPALVAGTGFLRSDEAWIDRVANQIPLLLEANFSLGAHWLGRALSAAGRLPPGFDLSILEAHRRGKRDRPSGTAREIARRIGPLRPLPTAEVDAAAPEDPGEIEIASLRTGEIPGVHQIWVSGPHELLRIEHLVLDRAAFAGGMLWAAMRLWERKGELPARRYYLDELLDTEATP